MNKIIRRIFIVVILGVSALVGMTGISGTAMAEEGGAWFGGDDVPSPSGGGGGGGGGGCNASANLYRIDCAGLSWVYYEAQSNSSDSINFPSAVVNSFAVNNAYIDGQCSEHADVKDENNVGGGFWHFGINGLAGSGMIEGGGNGHWQTVTYGYFKQYLPGNLYKQLVNANQSVGVYSANNFKTQNKSSESDVLKDYQEAWKADRKKNGIAFRDPEDVPTSIAAGTYAFCYWDGMAGNMYYAKSNTSMQELDGVASDYATTEITRDGSAEASIQVELGKEVQIVFSHNPYSTEGEGTPKWHVYRTWFDEAGGEYASFGNSGDYFTATVPGEASGTYDNNAVGETDRYGDVTDWTKDGVYYLGDPRGYSDGTTNFVARDVVNVKFNEEEDEDGKPKGAGKWKFCEKFTVYDEGKEDEKVVSNVCAVVEVREEEMSNYYSVSNVSNSASTGFATTGITKVPGTRVFANLATVEIGSTVEITFSHNVYADRLIADVNVPWAASRSGLSSTASYTVNPILTVALNGSNKMTQPEEGYYTIADAERHNDGYGYYYIVREKFNVTFNTAGTYTFCETIGVDGTSITTACSRVTVQSTTIITPSECGKWTPSSYTTSGRLYGWTVSGTTSILSKIQNPRLTDDAAHYGGWRGDFGTTGSGPVYTTYAMPTDTINWANCYYPGVQALANKRIVKDNADPEPLYSNRLSEILFRNQITWTNNYYVKSSTDSSNGVFRVGSIVTGLPNTVVPSSGAFMSTNGNGSNPFKLNVGLLVGDTTSRESSNGYKVLKANDAGKTYTEVASTDGTPYKATVNYGYHTWYYHCCCGGCTCGDHSCCCSYTCPCYRHTNSFERGNYAGWTYSSGKLTSTTQVIVPYNFINTASFGIVSTSPNVAYAGDSITVQGSTVMVNTRQNAVTEENYTTQVDNAEVRLVAYVSDKPASAQTQEQTPTDYGAASTNICSTSWLDKKQCMEVNKYNGGTTKLNPDGDLRGKTHSTDLGFDNTYNVFDASAGDYMCFVMAVFPWRSGPVGDDASDKTTNPAGTESKWLITAPQCKIIAKKPSVQILGGNIYTEGAVTASVSKKHNLYNATNYAPLSAGATYFGSFVEEGLIANGLVNRFASGAAIGRTTTNAAGYGTTLSNETEYCSHWVPLSFANYSKTKDICGNNINAVGYANISSASIVDRTALVDYFIPSDAELHEGASYQLQDAIGTEVASGSGKDIRYVKSNGTVTISASMLGVNQTRVVSASSVTIDGNIEYGGEFTTMAQVPKAVIYSSGDIHINCGVSRVDAIMIAGGTVYSCEDYTVAGGGDMQAWKRSQSQLVVNGAIIADELELGRTYGNAAGAQSGKPAEVVNYDTSALVWGRSAAGSNDSNAMSTVYQHELAPRY